MRLAVGGRYRGAAMLAAGEAAVDAVTVWIVGDDEEAVFGRSRRGREQNARQHQKTPRNPHSPSPGPWQPTRPQATREGVSSSLTLDGVSGSSGSAGPRTSAPRPNQNWVAQAEARHAKQLIKVGEQHECLHAVGARRGRDGPKLDLSEWRAKERIAHLWPNRDTQDMPPLISRLTRYKVHGFP